MTDYAKMSDDHIAGVGKMVCPAYLKATEGRSNLVTSAIALALVLIGCSASRPQGGDLSNLGQRSVAATALVVEDARAEMAFVRKGVGKSTEVIRHEARAAADATPDDAKPAVVPSLNRIDAEAVSIDAAMARLAEAQASLKSADTQLKQLQGVIDGQQDQIERGQSQLEQITEERDKLADARDAVLVQWMAAVIVGCVIGIGAGAAASMFGAVKVGVATIIGCITSLVVAVTVQRHPLVLGITGAAVVILAVGALAYTLWLNRKAFSESVRTVEAAKQTMPQQSRDQVFGPGSKPAVPGASLIQSPATTKLVKAERKRWRVEEAIPTTLNGRHEQLIPIAAEVGTHIPPSQQQGVRA